ncbi:hypothetical protein [Adlercreutzia sp. ZJ141]|uniref:hypothetical protein n=1 Tax=Adlercreutzia sp. ZJ141 TaxID=2709406 RepID=UPI0013ED0123|nr:hypothetical protein [Adlercreutzia sp. ZJ141]
MRFAADIIGLRKHCAVIQQERVLVDQLLNEIEYCKIQLIDLAPTDICALDSVCWDLRNLKDSITFRMRFVEETADEVQKMINRDFELEHESNKVLKLLGIRNWGF